MRSSRWVSLFVVALAAVAAAQVPLSKEPHHKVTFENAQFRILDVNVPPGETAGDHRHELDIATVAMSDGPDTRIQISGKPWGAAAHRALGDARVTEYSGKPLIHRIENLGKTAYQLFAVENLRQNG